MVVFWTPSDLNYTGLQLFENASLVGQKSPRKRKDAPPEPLKIWEKFRRLLSSIS